MVLGDWTGLVKRAAAEGAVNAAVVGAALEGGEVVFCVEKSPVVIFGDEGTDELVVIGTTVVEEAGGGDLAF